jgi:hypothetical protein
MSTTPNIPSGLRRPQSLISLIPRSRQRPEQSARSEKIVCLQDLITGNDLGRLARRFEKSAYGKSAMILEMNVSEASHKS